MIVNQKVMMTEVQEQYQGGMSIQGDVRKLLNVAHNRSAVTTKARLEYDSYSDDDVSSDDSYLETDSPFVARTKTR